MIIRSEWCPPRFYRSIFSWLFLFKYIPSHFAMMNIIVFRILGFSTRILW